MKTIDITTLDDIDFFAKDIVSMPQYWQSVNVFNTLTRAKSNDAFLYFRNVSGDYELAGGGTFHASSGDLVYIPFGARYKTVFTPAQEGAHESGGADTMLINFKLFDGGGMFLLSEQITTIAVDHAGRLEAVFSKVLEENNLPRPRTTKVKSAFFALLSAVIMSKRGDELKDVVFRRIKPGIDYLDNDPEQRLSIDRIAMLCGMSASLFRRIFAKYAGMSPLAYRNFRKLERAKAFLSSGLYNISETGYLLGFEDAAYFSRFFKKQTGISPREYLQARGTDVGNEADEPPQ